MSQTYASHVLTSNMKSAMSEGEKMRTIGQNLNGCELSSFSVSVHYNWHTYFKPVYDIRKAQYLADPNLVDVNWPLDYDPCDGDWFREPINPQVTNITSNSATITWTTPEEADSWVVCTSEEDGYWWCHKVGEVTVCPDGDEYDETMVTNHSITVSTLDSGTNYEFKIRSTNDTNDPPDVNEQITWGYIGEFSTPE